MDILNQVCTLEQAKRLKELGVAEGAHFCHVRSMLSGNRIGIFPTDSLGLLAGDANIEHAPAFTVAELGVMTNSEEYTMRDGFEVSEYANWAWFNSANEEGFDLFATEAEARAHRLIHLLESGRVTAAEVNARLKSA